MKHINKWKKSTYIRVSSSKYLWRSRHVILISFQVLRNGVNWGGERMIFKSEINCLERKKKNPYKMKWLKRKNLCEKIENFFALIFHLLRYLNYGRTTNCGIKMGIGQFFFSHFLLYYFCPFSPTHTRCIHF